MSAVPLRIVPTPLEITTPAERLRAAIKPEFRVDVYVPQPGDLILWGPPCVVDGCAAPRKARGLCEAHYIRFKGKRAAKQGRAPTWTPEEFIASPEHNGGPHAAFQHTGFAFNDLPPLLADELRLYVQQRQEDRARFVDPALFRRLRTYAQRQGFQSLFPNLDDARRLVVDGTYPNLDWGGKSQQPNEEGMLKEAMRDAAEVYFPLPLEQRNIIRVQGMPKGVQESARGQRNRTLDFNRLDLPWLRDWVRRYALYRLNTKSWGTAIRELTCMTRFERWLVQSKHAPNVRGVADISRDLLLDYVVWLRGNAASPHTAVNDAHTVSKLLQTHRLLDWEPALQSKAVLFVGELPQRDSQTEPDPFPREILEQMFAAENFERYPVWLQTALMIFREHGLRPSSVCLLRFDCIEYVGGEPKNLIYHNKKRNRDRAHPIREPLVVAAIERQRAAVLERYPNGSEYLFPAFQKNPDGSHPLPTASLRRRFLMEMDRIDFRDQYGNVLKVSRLYQFRDSFGTELLEAGVSVEAIRYLLDHQHINTVSIYAKLRDDALRKQFDQASKFNGHGELIASLPPDSPLSDLEFARHEMNRASIVVENGFCTLTLRQSCPNRDNPCLTCDYYMTTPDFLDGHLKSLEMTNQMLLMATEQGQTRKVEKLRGEVTLRQELIATLKSAAGDSHAED